MKSKLIRDKIPEIVKSKWEQISISIANQEEFRIKLFEKLIEESNEVIDAKTKSEIIEEMADLYEVIDSILENEKIDKSDVLKIQKEKKYKRWWFDKKILLKED